MATKHPCRETGKVLKFWILWILGFLPLTLAITSNVSDHDLEIMNLLKKLNKPYVKSIKSPDGDIIDCVLFHLQPAFDNPLNQNITFEMMRPSFYPKGFPGNHSSSKKPVTQLWHANGRCPEGTVPIRRTTKEDILRAESIQSFGKKTPGTFRIPGSPPDDQTNDAAHEYAVRIVRGGRFRGTRAVIGVWNPRVEIPEEFSLAQMWIYAGTGTPDLNTIEVGWQVYPNFYGDDRTRLFGFWTRDSYRNGCYNLACNAFVQYSNSITLGGVIGPVSVYGVVQREVSMFIFKEPISGNWWLEVGGEAIGYWPSHLFTLLRDGSATSVDWGGEVVNRATNGRHTATHMGSGRFSIEPPTRAADFTDVRVLDEAYVLRTPVGVETRVTNARCYDLIDRSTVRLGERFSYGGPGRNHYCP